MTTLLCSKCSEPMPPLPDDLAGMLRAGAPVTLAHDVCPTETPPAPEGRYFEVRCRIVEVAQPTEPPMEPFSTATPQHTELASFTAAVTAADLEAAMRPLAEALGEKWLEVEKHSRIADPGVTP